MQSEKKIYLQTQPKLYDFGGNLSKTWYILYRDANGKRIKTQKGINKHQTVKDRRKAAKELINEIVGLKKIVLQNRLRTKVFKYIELRKNSWKKKTYQAYKSKAGIFFDWLGDRPVNRETILGFFREYLMQRTGTTYNTYKFALSALFKHALDLDMKYILEDLEHRKSHTQTPVYFSKKQIELLHTEIKKQNRDLWLFVQFIYYGFMRPSAEVRFLRVGDVMLDENRILLHGDTSKTHKTRYIQIPTAFKPILEEELEHRDFREFIFHSKDPYKPVGVNTFRERHIKILKKNRFDTSRYKLYGWKNTGMVQALKAGFSLKWIQQQAGHHSLEQTDIYFKSMGIFTMDADLSKFPSF